MDALQLNGWLWTAWFVYWFVASKFVNKTKVSEGALVRMQHLAPLIAGLLLIFRPEFLFLNSHHLEFPSALSILGNLATFLGLLFAVWGRVHLGKYWSGIITLKEGHQLIRSGPYRFVRHPLYTGFVLAVLGSTLVAGTIESCIGFFIIVFAYLIKIHREEKMLTLQFGDEYRRFKSEVKTLIPYVY